MDQLSTEARNRYWAEVNPQYKGGSPEENNKSIRRLLEAQRPRAAFASTQYMLDEIQPPLLVEMLLAMAKSDKEENEGWQLNDCAIRNAFKLLNSNSELTLGEKAALEYAYLEVLSPPYGEKNPQAILHLERCIEELPELFVQAVAYAHKRKDNKEVPPGNREDLAKRGRQLLEAIKRIPGQEEASKEEQYDKLSRWVASVRESCASLNLLNVADEHLGNLFSKALPDKNGVWPCETVRDVMEDLKSEDVSVGAYAGLYNARGAHVCAKDGSEERELADKYRSWAEALQFTHPFVCTTVLMPLVHTYEREAEQNDTKARIKNRLAQ